MLNSTSASNRHKIALVALSAVLVVLVAGVSGLWTVEQDSAPLDLDAGAAGGGRKIQTSDISPKGVTTRTVSAGNEGSKADLPIRESLDLEKVFPPSPPAMEMEKMLTVVQERLAVDERMRRAILAPYSPIIETKGKESIEAKFGQTFTEAEYLSLIEVESSFNADLEALGGLYAQDFDFALQEIWLNRDYSIENPLSNGSFRRTLPGESSIQFPDKAFFYSVNVETYPHLTKHISDLSAIMADRRQAVRQRVREFR